MTGKLDIGRGSDSGFFPRLWKAHGEAQAGGGHWGSVVRIDASSIPASGLAGSTAKIAMTVDGVAGGTNPVDANATRAEVLARLVAALKLIGHDTGHLGHVSATGDEILLKPAVGVSITAASVVYDDGQTNPAPPSDPGDCPAPARSGRGKRRGK